MGVRAFAQPGDGAVVHDDRGDLGVVEDAGHALVGYHTEKALANVRAALPAIGAFILSGAFMYVGYSMAFGGKKWTDVAMVAYGAMIAGMGPMLVAWFFS